MSLRNPRHLKPVRSASSAMLERTRQELIDAALSNDVDLCSWLLQRLQAPGTREGLCTWLSLLQQRYAPAGADLHAQLQALLPPIEAGTVTRHTAQRLIRAGLGLMFVRFDVAFQRFYLHDILTDLVPGPAKEEVAQVLFVPAGEGSVGGVVSTIQKRWAQEVAGAAFLGPAQAEQAVVSLWSSFSDPRGRVANEDQVLGTRSWLAATVFDDASEGGSSALAGLLIAFFPVDGALQPQDPASASALKHTFWKLTSRIRHQLLLALENEALSTFLEPSSERAGAQRISRSAVQAHRVARRAGVCRGHAPAAGGDRAPHLPAQRRRQRGFTAAVRCARASAAGPRAGSRIRGRCAGAVARF